MTAHLLVKNLSDQRLLQEDAYVRRKAGVCLYRVQRRTASQVVLEDAYRPESLTATTATDVLENYLLVRARQLDALPR